MAINLPSSRPQASVATFLESFRKLYLQQALSNAIATTDLRTINAELDRFVPSQDLNMLATRGIRAEFLFALPCLLRAKSNLLGYYRLLLGYSQKEFYNKSKLGRLKSMEEPGRLTSRVEVELPDLCAALVERASELLHAIGPENLTLELLDDLSLLTLGPQLRGSNNTRIGIIANRAVFEIIQEIVKHAVLTATESRLEVLNASNRKVVIAFSADPDISIFEEMTLDERNIVAIEVKGGADASNIWNRLGEAEKSHQSAKQRGFVEFWTIFFLLRQAVSAPLLLTASRWYKKSLLWRIKTARGDPKDNANWQRATDGERIINLLLQSVRIAALLGRRVVVRAKIIFQQGYGAKCGTMAGETPMISAWVAQLGFYLGHVDSDGRHARTV